MPSSEKSQMFVFEEPKWKIMSRKLWAEFLGCFLIGIAVSQIRSSAGAEVTQVIGYLWLVLMYCFGNIVGGHFNMAVSFAVWLRGRLKASTLLLFWVTQFLGSLVGALAGRYVARNDVMVPEKDANVSDGRALSVELIWSAAIVYVFLHVCTTRAQAGNSFYGIAVGLFYLDSASAAVYSSGVFFPNAVLASGIVAEHGSIQWMAIVGPFIGAAIGVICFALTNPKEFRMGLSEGAFASYIKWELPAYMAEFLGTLMLCFTAMFTGGIPPYTLLAFVYAGGYVSGGHYNPAVTLAVTARGLCKVKTAIIYIVLQMGAGLLAGVMGHAVTQADVQLSRASDGRKFVAEFFFTMLLTSTVLSVTAPRNMPNAYYGLAIGFVLLAGGGSIGYVSGAVFNPAVGAALCTHAAGNMGKTYWVYLVAPCLGGLLGAASDWFLHPHNYDEKRAGETTNPKNAPLLGDTSGHEDEYGFGKEDRV